MFDPDILKAALLLAVAAKAIVDYLAEPVRKKYPNLDMWWIIYPAFVIGGAVGYIADINLFETVAPGLVGVAGRILTACVVGGGSSLIHNVTDHPDVRTVTTSAASVSPQGVLTTETVATQEPTA